MTRTLRHLVLAAGIALAVPAFAEVTFYEHDDFGGRSFTIDRPVQNFERFGFNDRASSAMVRRGTYEVCDDANFGGRCVTLTPGEYRSLSAMGLNDRVSSVRPAGVVAGGPRYDEQRRGGRRGGARAVLFGRPNLEGRGFVLEGNEVVRNMERSGFNDRASSLRVERGYWMFCSDADFEGSCRTFGPGDYTILPPDLNNRISSGRPISDRYPYQGRPNWDRR